MKDAIQHGADMVEFDVQVMFPSIGLKVWQDYDRWIIFVSPVGQQGPGAGPVPRVQAVCADQDQGGGRAHAGDSSQGPPAPGAAETPDTPSFR